MIETRLPSRDQMLEALLARDASFDGVFITAVKTTGIFCRPACPARRPRPENIEFYATPRDALVAGFRPCRRCRPLEPPGTPPGWVRRLVEEVEGQPARRWTDQDLRALGLDPRGVRRWFRSNVGMTFHAYSRTRRLGAALGRIQNGDGVTRTAFESGYESLSGFNEAFRQLFGRSPTRAGGTTRVMISRVPTPLGVMVAGATEEGLCLLEFADRRMLDTQLRRLERHLGAVFLPGQNDVTRDLSEQLAEYFEGERRRFCVPLLAPGTPFQREVWDRLVEIPYGETTTYGALARALGRPKAVRAVAGANGDNRIAVLIPCHRVVGADGALTGYGGGLWRKQRLLELEGSTSAI